jgi:cytidylate kinase
VALISISRLPYTRGEAIARSAAARLGYACINDEVFRDAAQRSGLPQARLESAFRDAPVLFGMSRVTRRICAAHVRAALAAYFIQDNVVYHGPFGAHLIHDVSHLLRVRIHAELEDRIALKQEREGCAAAEARRAILKQDKMRGALAMALFSASDDEKSLFDLDINTSSTDVDAAVDAIVETIGHRRYQPMTYSVGRLRAEDLSNRVRVSLLDLDPEVEVRSVGGHVTVRLRTGGMLRSRRIRVARERASQVEGVREVKVEIVEDVLDRIVGGHRLG